MTERHRVVLHNPVNGGNSCPHLVQAKPCTGVACDEEEDDEGWTSSGKTIFYETASERDFDLDRRIKMSDRTWLAETCCCYFLEAKYIRNADSNLLLSDWS